MRGKISYKSILSIVLIFSVLMGIWVKTDHLSGLLQREHSQTKEQARAASAVSSSEEMRAVWISYLEFQEAGMSKMSEAKFKTYVNKMFDQCVKMNMNTVIVQVRPFGDALYASDYFPWSAIASGKQGRNPGYDPLEYMVKAAHERGLEIEAWVNPYRVTLSNMKVKSLAKDNQAKKWINEGSRNVLYWGGLYYYNPSKEEVQQLIVDGILEIVQKYDVDGIHFDDYFYPCLGGKYKTGFDGKEYSKYANQKKSDGEEPASIVNWRRKNVDSLLKKVYAGIKDVKPTVRFGVSPAGNMSNLYAKDRYYCDVKKWMREEGYVDYICPQIYWSFSHKVCPYTKTVKRWADSSTNENIKLYIGLAAYRAGMSYSEARRLGDTGWCRSKAELKKQVVTGRKYKKVDGFVFFRYNNLTSKKSKTEMKNLKKVM